MGLYQDTSNKLGNNTTSMGNAIDNVKKVSFDGVWSGESHNSLKSTLNKVLSNADNALNDLENFKDIMSLLEEYKSTKEKIEELIAQRNSIVVPPANQYNQNSSVRIAAQNRRAQLAEQINKLETQNKELRERIESKLSQFKNIPHETELIIFDLNDYKDYAKFLMDIHDLIEIFYNGREEELQAKLNSNSSLADLYEKIDTMTLEEFVKYLNDLDNEELLRNLLPKNNSDIAHRGYGSGENTAQAFIKAGEMGFWGCEADIRFDKNGNLVCSHDTVNGNESPTSFEEYLDICKKYGMTAIIDLKYEVGNDEKFYSLSPSVLKIIEEKGMMDSCILQTNMYNDVSNIRTNSQDARIWYLSNEISDKTIKLIEDNNVECLNLKYNDYSTEQINRINKLTDGNVDVCIWNVNTQSAKDRLLDKGATYIMSDNVLNITPYQDGEIDFNSTKGNYKSNNLNFSIDSLKELLTETESSNQSQPTYQTLTVSEKYDGPILCANPDNPAHSGRLDYVRADGVTVEESWCDINLKNSKELSDFYKFDGDKVIDGQKIKDMEYWVRDDGVQMIGPYVAVATDVITRSTYGIDDNMAGWEGGTYNYGDVVETTLGKGIVMGICTEALRLREQNGDMFTNLEIYTLWNSPGISGKVWSDDYIPPNYANDPLLQNTNNN